MRSKAESQYHSSLVIPQIRKDREPRLRGKKKYLTPLFLSLSSPHPKEEKKNTGS